MALIPSSLLSLAASHSGPSPNNRFNPPWGLSRPTRLDSASMSSSFRFRHSSIPLGPSQTRCPRQSGTLRCSSDIAHSHFGSRTHGTVMPLSSPAHYATEKVLLLLSQLKTESDFNHFLSW